MFLVNTKRLREFRPYIAIEGLRIPKKQVIDELMNYGFKVIASTPILNGSLAVTVTIDLDIDKSSLFYKLLLTAELGLKNKFTDYSFADRVKIAKEAAKYLHRIHLSGDSVFLLHDNVERENISTENKRDNGDRRFDIINSYYGSKVAFYFSWQQFYRDFMILPASMGIFLLINSYLKFSDALWLPSFFIVLCIWSTCFIEFWKR